MFGRAPLVVTGMSHPPARINPLLVVASNRPRSFLFAPVLAGSGAADGVCL
jgi:hypothetical protein